MIRHFARSMAVLALVFSAAACGDDDGPTSPSNITGTYPLREVNGDPVPSIVFEQTGYKLEVVSGNLIINAGNTFSESAVIRETVNGSVTTDPPLVCTGTYTRNGNSITFSLATSADCDASTYVGTINGTTVTVAYDAEFQAVYRK